MKTSWGVLKKDPELLWLTVYGAVFAVLGIAIGGLIALFGGMAAAADSNEWWESHGTVLYIAGFVATLLSSFSNVFFHGALVHGALDRLTGGDPTVRNAIAGTNQRFRYLLSWSVVSVIFASIMQAIRRRGGFIVDMFAWAAEAAWSVISFLVLPVIIAERKGPIRSIKRSTGLLKDTWGENLIGQFGIGIVGFVAALPGIALGGILAWIGNYGGSPGLIWTGIVVAALWTICVSLFFSALKSVYQAVLYCYAVKHEVPEGFEAVGIEEAFVAKEKKAGKFLSSI